MHIKVDDLSGSEVHELLREHLRNMPRMHSPPESIHALDLEALRASEITFWTVWEEGNLLGSGSQGAGSSACGNQIHANVVRASLKRFAKAMLKYILEEAMRRSYHRLSLETGSAEAFEPARRLYASFGFTYCGPFADYVEDPYSVFMTREI